MVTMRSYTTGAVSLLVIAKYYLIITVIWGAADDPGTSRFYLFQQRCSWTCLRDVGLWVVAYRFLLILDFTLLISITEKSSKISQIIIIITVICHLQYCCYIIRLSGNTITLDLFYTEFPRYLDICVTFGLTRLRLPRTKSLTEALTSTFHIPPMFLNTP